MESISLGCITQAALGLDTDEIPVGDVELARIESALSVWEYIVDTLLCEPEAARKYNFLMLQILRDTRQLCAAVAFLREPGLHVPVHVEFCQELGAAAAADAVESVIFHLAADGGMDNSEKIAVLVSFLRELVEEEVSEAAMMIAAAAETLSSGAHA